MNNVFNELQMKVLDEEEAVEAICKRFFPELNK